MIAQDFARVGVLRSGSIATPYGVATMCAHAGKFIVPHRRRLRLRPWPDPTVRGRGQRSLFPAGFWKYGITLLELKDIYLLNERLGEISGLGT